MTTTKPFNSFIKYSVFFLILSAFSQGFAATTGNSKWVLAAEPFVLKKKSDSQMLNASCKSLPVLILEQLNENLTRIAASQEILDQKLYELQKERVSNFLQLSKEVQTRDAVFLNDYSPRKLKAKIKESDKKIKEIEDKISENLKSVEKLKNEYNPKIAMEEENRKRREAGEEEIHEKKDFFSFINGTDSSVNQDISLYKSDFRQLFTDLNSTNDTDYSISNNEKKVVDAGINCLMTGRITAYGEYISVAVTLYSFPAGRVIGRAADVGSLSDLNALAQNISNIIQPEITDSLPVELFIEINPPEIKKITTVTIDDVVYKNNFDQITVNAGLHTVSFSADGYDVIQAVYSFTGKRQFNIKASMVETKIGEASLRLTGLFNGDIFYNGKFGNSITDQQKFSQIKIDGKNVLGHFKDASGETADFFIRSELLKDGAKLKVNLKPFDRSKFIDTRRRWMYSSYSLLIVSLMPYFFCYGNYYAAAQAYNNRYTEDRSTAEMWQTSSYICGGISIGCACLFIYELVRYLVAANTVLPDYASELTPAQMKKLEEKDRKALEKKEKQLEKQKEKEKQLADEENKKNNDKNINQSENETEKTVKSGE